MIKMHFYHSFLLDAKKKGWSCPFNTVIFFFFFFCVTVIVTTAFLLFCCEIFHLSRQSNGRRVALLFKVLLYKNEPLVISVIDGALIALAALRFLLQSNTGKCHMLPSSLLHIFLHCCLSLGSCKRCCPCAQQSQQPLHSWRPILGFVPVRGTFRGWRCSSNMEERLSSKPCFDTLTFLGAFTLFCYKAEGFNLPAWQDALTSWPLDGASSVIRSLERNHHHYKYRNQV